MNARERLAAEIRRASQPPPKTPEQIEFERFLKCPAERDISSTLAGALTPDGRYGKTAAPLIAPSQLLPPMF